jgi:hypothetical protein
MRAWISSVVVALASTALIGCVDAGGPGDDGVGCEGKCDVGGDPGAPELCVAIRGNGQRLTSHLGALARIVEHYGLVDAAAGGSSGSISSFLIDSIQASPLVRDCDGKGCSENQAAARAAFLLKSTRGLLEVVHQSDEVQAFSVLADLAGRFQEHGVPALLESDPEAGVEALWAVLESPVVRDLVNPEVFELLASSPDPVWHARDLVAAATGALSFRADDPTIFVRPGLVDFDAVADKLGRVASFYAGYAPADLPAMAALLDDCAAASRGLDWDAIGALPAGESTCGARFADLAAGYLAAVGADPAAYPSRADDPVGAGMPVLLSTSVLEGAAVEAFHAARDDYRNARPVVLDVDFADVYFGYWGRGDDLGRVAANPRGFADLKTRKFRALGQVRWRDVLGYSPAEPGLTRALELPDGRVSAGGWSDLQPVLVLENLGCEQIVYLTRRGAGSSFLAGVTALLGIDAAEREALYDLTAPGSAYYQSLAAADGVWCTDWDAPSAFDLPAMYADGYEAPFETSSAFFTAGAEPYASISPRLGLPGCTPGVP